MANKMADKKKNASQSRMVEPRVRGGEKEKELSKNVKAATRERAERRERESRPARIESKQPSSTQQRFRNNRIVRFVLEAYRELRYKVTWPTVEEARNMTIAVIALSAAVGAILGLADLGLFQLFRLLNGR